MLLLRNLALTPILRQRSHIAKPIKKKKMGVCQKTCHLTLIKYSDLKYTIHEYMQIKEIQVSQSHKRIQSMPSPLNMVS
jgi:hypothetical protein